MKISIEKSNSNKSPRSCVKTFESYNHSYKLNYQVSFEYYFRGIQTVTRKTKIYAVNLLRALRIMEAFQYLDSKIINTVRLRSRPHGTVVKRVRRNDGYIYIKNMVNILLEPSEFFYPSLYKLNSFVLGSNQNDVYIYTHD